MADNDDHQGVVLEDIQDQIKRLAEAMAEVPADVRQLKTDVEELKTDMKIVKAVVTDQSGQLTNHEKRILHLEQAA